MRKKLTGIFLIVIILMIALFSYLSFGYYSKSSIAGTLVKLSKKGFLFQTYEGKLNTQMYIDGNVAASAGGLNLWDFSVVKDDTLIAKIEQAMLDGHRVKLEYRERFYKLPWIGDTKYIVYDMEELDKKK